jgi:hypothetical protein
MASRLRDLEIDGVVIAVDTWLGAWDHWVHDEWFRELGLLDPARGIFATFLTNVRSAGLEDYIVPLPLDSINAAQVLNHFNVFPDVVHIDAGHDHAAVLADIRQWWPLLKPGGLLIGDDYRAGNDWPGVKRAFDDYFRPLGLIPLENVNEKCRVSKPQSDPRESNLLSTMTVIGSAVWAWREACRIELADLIENESIGIEEQLERYLRFGGPNWNDGRMRLMNRITDRLRAGGQDISRGDLFGADGEIKEEVVQAAIPSFTAHYLRAAQTDGFERFELLPEFDNPFAGLALPPPLNINMGKAKGPALVAYRTEAVDLFLSAMGYQLFRASDGIYWPAVSTRAYPQEAMECPHVTVDKCVVIVQDVFEGSSYAHFLLDWVPRLGNFLNSGLADPSCCVFVLGGVPSEFHVHVIRALCEIYSLSEKQFVFPQNPQIWHIAGSVYCFSDLKETIMHPAHMAHRRSMAIMREVCSHIRTSCGEGKRIYISRGDTPLRRIANETELFDQLRSFGFMEVRLGSIPFLEQVKLVRGADVIVAPHGMGLTHIAFHQGQPLILELHNPAIGTDAYAFIAHALGFKYRAILGTDLGGDAHHFNVLPQDVVRALSQEGISPVLKTDSDAPPGIHTKFMGGVQSIAASEVLEISPFRPHNAVYRHVRDDERMQPDNNVGWLEAAGLIKGGVYHCYCEVWIPSDFRGNQVIIECANLASAVAGRVNLASRDQWQTIGINGVATECVLNFVLRCDSDAGAVFYSSGWSVSFGAKVNGT